MRPRRIDADAEDLRTGRTELFDPLSELGKLIGSPRAEVEDIRQQNDRSALDGVREAHGLPGADGKLEIWGAVASAQ